MLEKWIFFKEVYVRLDNVGCFYGFVFIYVMLFFFLEIKCVYMDFVDF